MKTRTLVLATALLLGATVTATANGNESLTTYSIDTKTSKVYWTGNKVGGSHSGTINIASGQISAKNKRVSNASLVMDMKSINNTDLEDAAYKAKLEGHLKSDDFFAVEKFSEASFKVTKFSPIANAKEGASNYTIAGDLTIKGITHSVSFPGLIAIKGNQALVIGTLTFDRSKWNVQYGSGSFFEGLGDHLIYDDVDLKFELHASAGQVN